MNLHLHENELDVPALFPRLFSIPLKSNLCEIYEQILKPARYTKRAATVAVLSVPEGVQFENKDFFVLYVESLVLCWRSFERFFVVSTRQGINTGGENERFLIYAHTSNKTVPLKDTIKVYREYSVRFGLQNSQSRCQAAFL